MKTDQIKLKISTIDMRLADITGETVAREPQPKQSGVFTCMHGTVLYGTKCLLCERLKLTGTKDDE